MFQKYLETVVMDITYRTNKYLYPLLTAMVIDCEGHGIPVMHAYLRKEDTAILEHVLRTFGELNSFADTHCFVVDKDMVEIAAVAAVFPDIPINLTLTLLQNYKHKTDTDHPTEGRILAALEAVTNGMAFRKAAEEFGISKSAPQRYQVKQAKQKDTTSTTPLAPNYQHTQIFTVAQEKDLIRFIVEMSDLYHGYTYKQLRVFAYEMAVSNNIKIPQYWKDNKMASIDWHKGFVARNGEGLALRAPEPTSLARATAFNRFNVETFFNNPETCYQKAKSSACTIFNLDETGCTTTHKPPKILARKGSKQVGKVVSQERGELLTVCAIVSAAGISIPPVLVFPRKNYKDIFMRGGPEGALGLVNPSGWMNVDLFLEVLKHFVQHARPAPDHQVVLVMDNHESHVSLAAREYAKENNVHIVTLPPHTSHRTQPLDRAVFGPMKTYLNSASDAWILANPGRAISIYDMAGLIREAWMRASTPSNITSGFRVSGVWPFDRHAFDDEGYLASNVTDRPCPVPSNDQAANPVPSALSTSSSSLEPGPSNSSGPESASVLSTAEPSLELQPGPSNRSGPESASVLSTAEPSLELQPGPSNRSEPCSAFSRSPADAPERKESTRGRKRGRSMVATSTPELCRLRMELFEKEKRYKTTTKSKKNLFGDQRDSDSDLDLDVDDILESDSESVDDPQSGHDTLVLGVVDNPSIDDFVLCEYAMKSKIVYYIGIIKKERDADDELEIEFLKRMHRNEDKFIRTQEDICTVHIDQLKAILPPPVRCGTTSRTKGIMVFTTDFGNLDLRPGRTKKIVTELEEKMKKIEDKFGHLMEITGGGFRDLLENLVLVLFGDTRDKVSYLRNQKYHAYLQGNGHWASQGQLSRFTEHEGIKAKMLGFTGRRNLNLQNQSRINGSTSFQTASPPSTNMSSANISFNQTFTSPSPPSL
ncbi:hypothetical protein EGW08_010598 [Elysia chlorotica]|uniref:DDE-1 domain-containing protein n=1 Tax=Elysia chlorotica TaxID=188477 RepID=A0A3S1HL00_ELYCH|nr:hypothetical protein EGW08_010598 [Elysia chlorotica]